MSTNKKDITPDRARTLLKKLPSKFSKFKDFAEKNSSNEDDEYVLSVFELIKYSDKANRIIPYCWEIEYEIEKLKNK